MGGCSFAHVPWWDITQAHATVRALAFIGHKWMYRVTRGNIFRTRTAECAREITLICRHDLFCQKGQVINRCILKCRSPAEVLVCLVLLRGNFRVSPH